MKPILPTLFISLAALAFQSCQHCPVETGPLMIDAMDKAFNPYQVGDSFKMKDSKTGDELWFNVTSRDISATIPSQQATKCELVHSQKELTNIKPDKGSTQFEMVFTKGSLNIPSELMIATGVNAIRFDFQTMEKKDSMQVLGNWYYQVLKGTDFLSDRSSGQQPLPKELTTIFYTQKDGIIQGIYTDSSTLDLVK